MKFRINFINIGNGHAKDVYIYEKNANKNIGLKKYIVPINGSTNIEIEMDQKMNNTRITTIITYKNLNDIEYNQEFVLEFNMRNTQNLQENYRFPNTNSNIKYENKIDYLPITNILDEIFPTRKEVKYRLVKNGFPVEL